MSNAPVLSALDTLRRRLRLNAVVGALAWAAAVVLLWDKWAELLVLLGALVVAPLAFALAVRAEADGSLGQPWRAMVWIQPPAALCILLSFGINDPILKMAFAVPWLIIGFLAARMGLFHSVRRGFEPLSSFAADVALIYFLVGTVWLLASRAGHEFLGFREPIVLLTAAHFHFAGLALPVLVSESARRRPDRLARVTMWAVLAGMPLVATGITVRDRQPDWVIVETICALLFVIACILAAVVQWRAAWSLRTRPTGWLLVRGAWWQWRSTDRSLRTRPTGWLLGLSSLSLLASMTLAAVYALGVFLGTTWIDIPTMVTTHATLNALGFAVPGLLGWNLEPEPEPEAPAT